MSERMPLPGSSRNTRVRHRAGAGGRPRPSRLRLSLPRPGGVAGGPGGRSRVRYQRCETKCSIAGRSNFSHRNRPVAASARARRRARVYEAASMTFPASRSKAGGSSSAWHVLCTRAVRRDTRMRGDGCGRGREASPRGYKTECACRRSRIRMPAATASELKRKGGRPGAAVTAFLPAEAAWLARHQGFDVVPLDVAAPATKTLTMRALSRRSIFYNAYSNFFELRAAYWTPLRDAASRELARIARELAALAPAAILCDSP